MQYTSVVYVLFFVYFFTCPLQGYAFLGTPHSSYWCLKLAGSQNLEYQKLMPLSCRRRQCAAQSPSSLFSSNGLCCADHTSGSPAPLLRRQAHHQPLTGNRSESRWVTTLREGESSAYHVSKVGRGALRSTRHKKQWRWRDVSHREYFRIMISVWRHL